MKRRSVLLLVLLSVASVVTGAGAASSSVNISGSADQVQVETHPDAEAYALDYGVPVAEASSRLYEQESSYEVRDALLGAAPGRLVGVRLEHGAEVKIVARYAGDEPVELPAVVEASDIPVEVITGYELTFEQVEASMDAVIAELEASGVTVDGIYYDEVTNTIVVDSSAAAPASVSAPSINAANGIDIPVRIDVHDVPAADGYRGGIVLTSCTSGFTVRNPAGLRGILTAAHCPEPQAYQPIGSKTWYVATYRNGLNNAYADVEWRSITAHTVGPYVYMASTLTPVTLRGYTMRGNQAGDYVCHRGKSTGYSCGTVNNVSYRPGNNICNGACGATWVRISGSSLRCYPGDSGGPFASGRYAYGIYKGQSSSGVGTGSCNYAFYMPIEYAFNLGISLLTG